MSNQPNFAYQRKRPGEPEPEKTFTIDDEEFRLRPKIGSRALDAFARANSDDTGVSLSGVVDSYRALLADDAEYERFIRLDLDDEELADILQGLIELYGDAGKSSGSPTASNGDGASSKPTSPASTASTSAA